MASINRFEEKANEALAKKGIKKLSVESLLWFEREIKKSISHGDARVRTVDKFGIHKEKFQVGQLVLYKYDAKFKDELPYWDACPLILVTRITAKGWYGVNLHYCPPRIRTWIMNALYQNNTRKNITERDRVAFSWRIARQIAESVGSIKHLEHSIKQYLKSHVKTVPLVIEPEYWDMIVHLPLARFQKGKPY